MAVRWELASNHRIEKTSSCVLDLTAKHVFYAASVRSSQALCKHLLTQCLFTFRSFICSPL